MAYPCKQVTSSDPAGEAFIESFAQSRHFLPVPFLIQFERSQRRPYDLARILITSGLNPACNKPVKLVGETHIACRH